MPLSDKRCVIDKLTVLYNLYLVKYYHKHAGEMQFNYRWNFYLVTEFPRLLESPGKSWILFIENSRTWKVLENHFCPGKSWKLRLKVLESPAKYP